MFPELWRTGRARRDAGVFLGLKPQAQPIPGISCLAILIQSLRDRKPPFRTAIDFDYFGPEPQPSALEAIVQPGSPELYRGCRVS
jgi:hypothetical protein